MTVKILGSSSAGNCYVFISNSGEVLIVDLGVSMRTIERAIDFESHKIVAGLITHEHGDHSAGAKMFTKRGNPVYMSQGTFSNLKFDSHNIKLMQRNKSYKAGGYIFTGFLVEHNTPEPFGFVIYHEEMGNVLYLTDTGYVDYRFGGLDNIMIEVNYDEDKLERNYRTGALHPYVYNRVKKTHLGLEDTLRILNNTGMQRVNDIILIHLSETNSVAAKAIEEIYKATKIKPFVAYKGEEFELTLKNKKQF